jgi:putative restriction endonuclease
LPTIVWHLAQQFKLCLLNGPFLLRQLMFRAAMPTLLGHCAVCRLKRDQLLEAAHIVGDRDERGTPTVTNGIALCSLHHAAFDAHLITVRPDYHVEVSEDVLHETDGPMLVRGLEGFKGQLIRLPRVERHRPDRERLEARYEVFRRAAF